MKVTFYFENLHYYLHNLILSVFFSFLQVTLLALESWLGQFRLRLNALTNSGFDFVITRYDSECLCFRDYYWVLELGDLLKKGVVYLSRVAFHKEVGLVDRASLLDLKRLLFLWKS